MSKWDRKAPKLFDCQKQTTSWELQRGQAEQKETSVAWGAVLGWRTTRACVCDKERSRRRDRTWLKRRGKRRRKDGKWETLREEEVNSCRIKRPIHPLAAMKTLKRVEWKWIMAKNIRTATRRMLQHKGIQGAGECRQKTGTTARATYDSAYYPNSNNNRASCGQPAIFRKDKRLWNKWRGISFNSSEEFHNVLFHFSKLKAPQCKSGRWRPLWAWDVSLDKPKKAESRNLLSFRLRLSARTRQDLEKKMYFFGWTIGCFGRWSCSLRCWIYTYGSSSSFFCACDIRT